MVTTTRPAQDPASALVRDGLMNLCVYLFIFPVHLMVEETQKPSELLDTELGMTLMGSFMEHLQKSRPDECTVWYGNDLWKSSGCGRGRGWWQPWHLRAPSMISQHQANPCLRWWHLAPSTAKLFAWVSMHSQAAVSAKPGALPCGKESPLQWENNFHISRSQHFPCHREEH